MASTAPAASAAHESGSSLSSPAREGQKVTHDGRTYTTVREGLAYILVPEGVRTSLDPKAGSGDAAGVQSVFYNPIQQFNRDLSVLAIRAHGEDLLAFRRMRAEIKGGRGRKRKRGGEGVGRGPNDGDLVANESAVNANGGTERIEVVQAPEHVLMETEESSKAVPGKSTQLNGNEKEPTTLTAKAEANSVNPPNQSRPSGRFRILDALSATGLRALRYSHEIPFVTSVTANDLSRSATDLIQLNVTHNNLTAKINTVTGNAMSHMYDLISHPNKDLQHIKYDVIDLDPYGTAVPFLDAAVQAVGDGGLLCVTCTDAGVWASCGYPEKTYSLYGGTPLKGLHSHEGGLRLILHSIASSAARYGLSIEPLLSLSIDFYARVFVRVFQSPAEVKMLAGKTMLVYNCDHGCGAWTTQFLARNQTLGTKNGQTSFKHSIAQGPTAGVHCEHCGLKTHMSGPMYGGPIHNQAFIQSILEQLPTLDRKTYATTDRLEGMLTTALEETLLGDYKDSKPAEESAKVQLDRLIARTDPMEVDRNPFFFVPSALAKVLHCRAPSEAEVRGALKHAAYTVTRSHARPGTIKTNAPWTFIWAMMKEWIRQKAPVKEGAVKPGTAGWGILHGPHTQAHRKSNVDAESVIPAEEEGANAALAAAASGAANTENEKFENLYSIVFDERLGKEANKKRLKRYQENPRANWGPMNRAKGPSSQPPRGEHDGN